MRVSRIGRSLRPPSKGMDCVPKDDEGCVKGTGREEWVPPPGGIGFACRARVPRPARVFDRRSETPGIQTVRLLYRSQIVLGSSHPGVEQAERLLLPGV